MGQTGQTESKDSRINAFILRGILKFQEKLARAAFGRTLELMLSGSATRRAQTKGERLFWYFKVEQVP